MIRNIVADFAVASQAYPNNLALVDGKVALTYARLRGVVSQFAGQLSPHLSNRRVGVLASRSTAACVGFLATGWAGGTYVPLGLHQPEDRLKAMLELLDLDVLVVDATGAKKLSDELLAVAPKVIFAPGEEPGTFTQYGLEEVAECSPLPEPVAVAPEHLAYIVFTSGTTGMPKGVMVNTRSISLYMDSISKLYALTPDDRAAETCESNFDLSIHNMLTTWRSGAALYIMRPLDLVSPARFIRKHEITTWLSVPSIVALARQSGSLTEGSLPSLRLTWFCGEPLSRAAVTDWSRAAPNSVIENFYGPTEITVAVVVQRWLGKGPITPERGIVAIGKPIDGVEVMICDENGNEVTNDIVGEIVLLGEQCSDGYFKREDLTKEVFKVIGGKPAYFTGDLGYRGTDGMLHHMGRKDNQIKFRGHRIELEEIDANLRKCAGVDVVGTVTWPRNGDVIEGLAGFFSAPGVTADEVREKMRKVLPHYMVPEILEQVDEMPLSANGKVDRKALIRMLDDRASKNEAKKQVAAE